MIRILVRVDSAPQIGTGHVMRCLNFVHALGIEARSLDSDLDVVFASRQMLPAFAEHIAALGYHHKNISKDLGPPEERGLALWAEDAQIRDAAAILQDVGPVDLIIVDHYGLDKCWEKLARIGQAPVICVDDLANRDHHADFIIDQTFPGERDRYRSLNKLGAKHLIGPNYALLAPGFGEPQSSLRTGQQGERLRLLISLGGMAPVTAINAILAALSQLDTRSGLEITILCGHSSVRQIQALVDVEFSALKINVVGFVDDMANFLNSFDLAIGAGGVSSLERCAVGLPSLLIIMADNQRDFSADLVRKNAAFAAMELDDLRPDILADFAAMTSEDHMRMAKNGQQMCDGLGAPRCAREIVDRFIMNANREKRA